MGLSGIRPVQRYRQRVNPPKLGQPIRVIH